MEYNIPAAALAGSVLYGLYVLAGDDERYIIDPQPDITHVELKQDVIASGIHTHLVDRSSEYAAKRRRNVKADAEYLRGMDLDGAYDYATKVIQLNKEIAADEVYNQDRTQFHVLQSNIKPTRVHTVDGSYPGVPDEYAFRQSDGRRPKVGRNEDPY